jgi:alcohol dehydrogenase
MVNADLSIESIFDAADLGDVPDYVRSFEHTPGTRIDFGCGAIERLCQHVRDLGASHVLVVTDPGIARAGHLDKVTALLAEGDIRSTVFDKVIANPTTKCVNACTEVARKAGIDLLIGLGGGSSMDTAKGCNFILTNCGRMQDYWGHDAKMACGDKKAAVRIAILDPELTITQPRLVTAHTGIDAIAHALESGVCNKRTKASTAYARAAFRLMFPAFPVVLDFPADLTARSRMLLGAALAGTAIENSMLGAAHSAANPLTAHFDIVHGEAVGIMLPHVMRFNAGDPEICSAYQNLTGMPDIGTLASTFLEYLKLGTMPVDLKNFQISATDIAKMAPEAAGQWTAQFNPLTVTAETFLNLYSSAN